jgi:hypothetical protein
MKTITERENEVFVALQALLPEMTVTQLDALAARAVHEENALAKAHSTMFDPRLGFEGSLTCPYSRAEWVSDEQFVVRWKRTPTGFEVAGEWVKRQ